MSIKLKDALFEMTNNEVHDIFENKKEIPIEDNIQTLSKATLALVSKAIAQKINAEIPDPEKIPDETLKKPLGIITYPMLNKLKDKPVKGLKANPAQIKGPQKKGLTPLDFSKYEKQQIVPLFLNNKEMENLGGKKGGDEFVGLFYVPALFAPIHKDNIALHKKFFDLKEPDEGNAAMHYELIKLHSEMITPEEVELIQKSFMTGNSSPLARIEALQPTRIPGGASEKMGASKDAVSDVEPESTESTVSPKSSEGPIVGDADFSLAHGKNLHEHSLASLLFEKKLINEKEGMIAKLIRMATKEDRMTGEKTSQIQINLDDLESTRVTGSQGDTSSHEMKTNVDEERFKTVFGNFGDQFIGVLKDKEINCIAGGNDNDAFAERKMTYSPVRFANVLMSDEWDKSFKGEYGDNKYSCFFRRLVWGVDVKDALTNVIDGDKFLTVLEKKILNAAESKDHWASFSNVNSITSNAESLNDYLNGKNEVENSDAFYNVFIQHFIHSTLTNSDAAPIITEQKISNHNKTILHEARLSSKSFTKYLNKKIKLHGLSITKYLADGDLDSLKASDDEARATGGNPLAHRLNNPDEHDWEREV